MVGGSFGTEGVSSPFRSGVAKQVDSIIRVDLDLSPVDSRPVLSNRVNASCGGILCGPQARTMGTGF